MNSNLILLVGDSGRFYTATEEDVLLGLSSCYGKDEHIPLIDWDDLPDDDIKEISAYLINKHKLPTIYVFRSSKGRRIGFACTTVSLIDYAKILVDSRCCIDFRYYTLKIAGHGTLRFTKKATKVTSNLKFLYEIQGTELEDSIIRDGIFDLVRWENAQN